MFQHVERAVTHPGHAHRDEYLSLGLMLAQNSNIVIERRQPTKEELRNPHVPVVDVGRDHDPDLLNFDHHQFDKKHIERNGPVCAVSLILQAMRLYEMAKYAWPWLKILEIHDAEGPHAAARSLGLDIGTYKQLMSPWEGPFLQLFQRQDKLRPGDDAHDILCDLGKEWHDGLQAITKRLNSLDDDATVREVKGIKVADVTFIDKRANPDYCVNMWCGRWSQKYGGQICVTVAQDGWGTDNLKLRRRQDHADVVDFCRIKGLPGTTFVHRGGHVATIEKSVDIDEMISKSIVHMSSEK